jgi:hypothetical protein
MKNHTLRLNWGIPSTNKSKLNLFKFDNNYTTSIDDSIKIRLNSQQN